jgi:hypothetical protein
MRTRTGRTGPVLQQHDLSLAPADQTFVRRGARQGAGQSALTKLPAFLKATPLAFALPPDYSHCLGTLGPNQEAGVSPNANSREERDLETPPSGSALPRFHFSLSNQCLLCAKH